MKTLSKEPYERVIDGVHYIISRSYGDNDIRKIIAKLIMQNVTIVFEHKAS